MIAPLKSVTPKTYGWTNYIPITSDIWVTRRVQLCILLGSTLQILVGSRRANITPLWGSATYEPISIKLNVCRSLQRNYVYQTWFENSQCFSRPTSWKMHVSLQETNGPYNIAKPRCVVTCWGVLHAPTYNSIPVEMCNTERCVDSVEWYLV